MKAKLVQETALLKGRVAEEKSAADQVRKIEAQNNDARVKSRVDAAKKASQKEVELAKESARTIGEIQAAGARESLRLTRDLFMSRQRQDERASRGGGGGGARGGGRDFAYRMGYWASRNLSPVTPMLSYAGRLGGDILRGTGVDFNVGSMVSHSVELQRRLVGLANQGYEAHAEGAASIRQDPKALDKDVRAVGKQYGFDYNEVAAAMTKFVDTTGNLEQARASMGGLARLANATTTDLSDMTTAAAAVAVQLDRAMGSDTQAKAQALQNIMRTFAGQGKLGAVEIKDLAVQMAKIAVVAPKFAGPIENVFADIGVLAQESRKAGGSASASQAATSVQRIADVLVNPKAQKAFTKQMVAAGMQPETLFADKGQTKLRPIEEIILTALESTKGALPKMQGLFKNVMANRAIEGFTGIFNRTGGNTSDKLKAVHEEFESLRKAAITEKEEFDNNARVMAEDAKKAQVFQNELQDIVSAMATKVIPAFERLAPMVLQSAEGFARVVGWLAENPFAVIPAAITAAIAKALTEQTLRLGIENVFRDLGGKAGPGLGGGFGVAGNIAAAITVASAAFTVYEVGTMYINSVLEQKTANQKESMGAELEGGNAESQLRQEVLSGKVSPETIERAKGAAARIGKALDKETGDRGLVAEVTNKAMQVGATISGHGNVVKAEERAHNERVQALLDEQGRVLRLIAVGGAQLKVQVMNQQPPPPPHHGGATTNSAHVTH